LRPPSQQVLADGGVSQDRVEFVEHRLGTDSEADLMCALEGIDCVFSMITPPVHSGTVEEFHTTNLLGIQHLVRACTAKGVPRLVHLSSIAVTNHLVASINMSEADPLPPITCYKMAYDYSKRKGEEVVLAANNETFNTCSFRPGGILLSPNDYVFTNILRFPGIVFAPSRCAEIDWIDGRDCCRGLLLAAQALGEGRPGVAGEAFFLSKAKGEGGSAHHIANLCVKNLGTGWIVIPVPPMILKLAFGCQFVLHHIKKAFKFRVPGFPTYRFYQTAEIQQTFDNSKVQKTLGFEPKLTLLDATSRICMLYTNNHSSTILTCEPTRNFVTMLIVIVPLIMVLNSHGKLPLPFGMYLNQ